MSAWIGKTAFLLGLVVFVAIRVPHDKRSKQTKIAESRKGVLEATLLALMGIGGFLLPLVFIVSPFFPSSPILFDYYLSRAASCVSVSHSGSFTGPTEVAEVSAGRENAGKVIRRLALSP